MNKIKKRIVNRKKPILNIYFTAGFPEIDSTGEILRSLDRSGVDLIEIGMPYSDPMADGPVIQRSSSIALKNGLTLKHIFEQIRSVGQDISAPMIMMGYLNQLMQYGVERFLKKAKSVGVAALIVPDLPPVLYEKEYLDLFRHVGVDIIFLITPQTSEARIRHIDHLSQSFIYMVSDSSITGGTSALSDDQLAYFRRVKEMKLSNPVLVGFGISDHRSFSQAVLEAPGAIIGSAFIKELEARLPKEGMETVVESFVNRIRNGE